MINPAEKNLKDKTDTLDWGHVPSTPCDLNFRAPDCALLECSAPRAYCHLLLPAFVASFGFVLIGYTCLHLLVERSLLEATIVAIVIGGLAASGVYRLFPRLGRPQRGIEFAVYGASSVLGFYLALRMMHGMPLFELGVVLCFCVALPWCLFVCDQMTGQIVHWHSADPRLSRNQMVLLRNAWVERFLSKENSSICARRRLQHYWLGHVSVVVSFAGGITIGFIAAIVMGYPRPGFWMIVCATSLMGALALRVYAAAPNTNRTYAAILGQWLEYQKDITVPPWVMKSPSGSQLLRAGMSCGATIVLAIGLLILALYDSRWPGRTVADLAFASPIETFMVAIGATVIAPAWIVMSGFVITTPTAVACSQLIEEVADE